MVCPLTCHMLSALSSLLAAALVPVGFLFLWPLVARWLGRNDPLTMLAAFGLSTGLLSLWTFALAWSGFLSVWPVLGLVALGWGLGAAFNRSWFRFDWGLAALRWVRATLARLDLSALALAVMLLSLAAVLAHNIYYPFLSDDTLTRYALDARLIYESHALPAEVQGAPLLVPLSFVYTWLVGSAVDEHLAKLVPFTFAAGMLGVTVLLGRRFAGRLTGLLAGAVLAVTPLFAKWAITGYTDISTGFYVALAALFALRWVEDGGWRDALLAGLMAGLACWTKQSALVVLASLVGVAILRILYTRRVQAGLVGLVPMLVPAVVIAGPWYLRNYLLGGAEDVLVLPGLYHVIRIGPRLLGVLPPLQYPADFGLPLTPLYALGLVLAVWRIITEGWAALRKRGTWPWPDLVGLAVLLPYWLAWWMRFSFTARFLLVVVPVYAVWAARPLTWLSRRQTWVTRYSRPLAGVTAALLLVYGLRAPLGGLAYAITHPFASDFEKLVRAKEDLYPTALWLRENLKPGERVTSMDTRLRYYLTDYEVDVGYPLSFEDLAPYDYVIDSSGTTEIYRTLGWTDTDYWQHRRDPVYFEEVFDGGAGSEILRILPTVEEEAR